MLSVRLGLKLSYLELVPYYCFARALQSSWAYAEIWTDSLFAAAVSQVPNAHIHIGHHPHFTRTVLRQELGTWQSLISVTHAITCFKPGLPLWGEGRHFLCASGGGYCGPWRLLISLKSCAMNSHVSSQASCLFMLVQMALLTGRSSSSTPKEASVCSANPTH